MKKILLSFALLTSSLLGYGLYTTLSGDETVVATPEEEVEDNLLANGTFSNPASLTMFDEQNKSFAEAPKGEWCYLNDGGNLQASVTNGGTEHPTAALFNQTASQSWFKAYIFQDVNKPMTPKEYTISFDAKTVSGNANLSILVYVGGNGKYAVRSDFGSTEEHPTWSAARYDKNLTSEWAHYEFKFDFSVYCNNVNTAATTSGFKIEDMTQEMLNSMVRICILNNNKVGSFMIDNVVLSSDQPEPEPETPTFDPENEVAGNLIMNGTFSNPATIGLLAKEDFTSDVARGEWMLMNLDNSKSVSAKVVDGGTEHPSAVEFAQTGAASWYNAYLFQNLKAGATPQEYVLSFDAKLVTGEKKLATFIYLEKNKVYATRAGFDKDATPGQSAGRVDSELTTEWAHFDIHYDFEISCNNLNAASTAGFEMNEVNQAQLDQMVRVCFCSFAKIGTYLIDNVVLKSLNDFSGVDNVAVDSENAPVEYYNLQGVRVENPSKGLYIKRQGNKASKVIL